MHVTINPPTILQPQPHITLQKPLIGVPPLMKRPGGANHRTLTLTGDYTANYKLQTLEPVSLVISAHFPRTSCPRLTNLSLQLAWFFSLTTGKLPNSQRRCANYPTHTHNHPQCHYGEDSCLGCSQV